MRTCPPGETTTCRQCIGPPRTAHLPPVGLLMAMLMLPAGTGVTRPRPLNTMADCPVVTVTDALIEPWAPARTWMMAGAGGFGSPGSALGLPHAPVGSARLTTQLVPEVDSAQLLSRVLVSWKRTGVLRRTDSARASMSPLWIASAAERIWLFCSRLLKLG